MKQAVYRRQADLGRYVLNVDIFVCKCKNSVRQGLRVLRDVRKISIMYCSTLKVCLLPVIVVIGF